MAWSASQLGEGFARSIIGFDLRDTAIDFDYYSGENAFLDLDIKKKFPATIDNQVWPESSNKYEVNSQCNGFNLFDQLDAEIKSVAFEKNVVLVAFDIPLDLADSLSSTFGLLLSPIKLLSQEQTWSFLGYDVVDIRTQSSAIYSFSWTEFEIKEIFRKLSLNLNHCGVIQSELDALRISSAFDERIPEHSPFAPCGVWISRAG